MKKIILIIIIALQGSQILYSQDSFSFQNADSMFCHDSLNHLSSFQDGNFRVDFEQSRFKGVVSNDSIIEINTQNISVKTSLDRVLTFWIKRNRFFIQYGDTIYSINNEKITKRGIIDNKEETVVQILNNGFTFISIDDVIFYISCSARLVDKVFFKLVNRTIMFEFFSSRGTNELEKISIINNLGKFVILYYPKTLKPYIMTSIPTKGKSKYFLNFTKRHSLVEEICEHTKVVRGENSREPDYEYKIYYIYNKRGVLYPESRVKVNVCK